jgi:hypothetical protein
MAAEQPLPDQELRNVQLLEQYRSCPPHFICLSLTFSLTSTTVQIKGVGPSTTLAWPGWKQPDIAVEVDTARLETSRFKKCCLNCVLLYYPSTEY